LPLRYAQPVRQEARDFHQLFAIVDYFLLLSFAFDALTARALFSGCWLPNYASFSPPEDSLSIPVRLHYGTAFFTPVFAATLHAKSAATPLSASPPPLPRYGFTISLSIAEFRPLSHSFHARADEG